jgi:phenylacetate-CoA ligase
MAGPWNRLRGSAIVLGLLPGQRGLAFRSAEQIRRVRDGRVRDLVRYAAETVPHYRELFAAHGIDPRAIRTAEDLDRLPLLDKDTVRQAPERFVSTSRRGQDALPFVTSGSTGTPLRIHHDIDSLIANIAYCEPEKDVIRRFLGRRRYRETQIFYAGSTVAQIVKAYRENTFVRSRARRGRLGIEMPPEAIVRHINAERPDMLNGYGSYLEALFRWIAEHGVDVHLPKVVFYGADAMSGPGRELIERHFGVPVFSQYNCVESFRLAFTCAEGTGFHVRDDLCHLKLVDDRGERVPPGVPGEVVISNLVNRGTVLLNYRLGDVAALSDAPCPCGRTLPLLSELHGRLEDVLYLPDGRMVHPRLVWQVFKRHPGVRRYQLVQREEARFELHLVVGDPAAAGHLVPAIAEEVKALLGEVELEVRPCDDIPPDANGKFRAVRGLRRMPVPA